MELISILEHPDIEDGAQIKLCNNKSFSPLRRAIEFKRSKSELDNPEDAKRLDDMT